MRQENSDIGHTHEVRQIQTGVKNAHKEDFVLEKSIFNNIFEKDIRRVFIYKKAERLAKAVHLVIPAFNDSMSLRNRISGIAISLVDAAILPTHSARDVLSRELLVLSSVLSIARSGGLLSSMNADLIARESHLLLQEVAGYEEPRLFLEEVPTLSTLAQKALGRDTSASPTSRIARRAKPVKSTYQGHIKDNAHMGDRREAILSIIRNKKKVNIKDISTLIHTVSEKTIQRELLSLITEGVVVKEGERRWSTYALA